MCAAASKYPDIILDIRLDDRFVDLVEEGFDLAVRVTKMEDSSLIAKRLSPFGLVLCASPQLIEKTGLPTTPQDLSHMPCVVDTNNRSLASWSFDDAAGNQISVAVKSRLEVNSPFSAKRAALAGIGYAFMPDFVAAQEIKSGRLVQVLPQFVKNGGGIYAVYPHRRYLPAKVRVLVDYLAHWFKDHANDCSLFDGSI
jgi:DNA-binding transcriptional LysR family regulator